MTTRCVLTVSDEIRQRIDDQARRDYPSETCGFLMGEISPLANRVLGIREAPNRNIENPLRFYEIDRLAYEEAEAKASISGLQLIGIYHSHPDSPPVPSGTDATFAFPDWIYWITPIEKGEPGDPRIWHRTWNPEGWNEWECVAVKAAG